MLCVPLTARKQEKCFCYGLEGVSWGPEVFLSLCAPRVTKSTTDGEQDKHSGDWSFCLFLWGRDTDIPSGIRDTSKPPVSLCSLLIPFLLVLRTLAAILSAFLKSRINDKQRLKVKFKTWQRIAYSVDSKTDQELSSDTGLRLCKGSITGMAWLYREQLWGIFFLAPWVFSEGSESKEKLRWITG